MTLQIIYSLETGQELANFPVTKEVLKTKKRLIQFATDALIGKHSFVPEGWKDEVYNTNHLPEEIISLPPKIHKLSLCVITEKGEKIRTPKWYDECKGKIWFADLHPNEENPY